MGTVVEFPANRVMPADGSRLQSQAEVDLPASGSNGAIQSCRPRCAASQRASPAAQQVEADPASRLSDPTAGKNFVSDRPNVQLAGDGNSQHGDALASRLNVLRSFRRYRRFPPAAASRRPAPATGDSETVGARLPVVQDMASPAPE
jgi:hypothetical protein